MSYTIREQAIDMATQIIHDAKGYLRSGVPHSRHESAARALAVAGLLADTADTTEENPYDRGYEQAWTDAQRDIDVIKDRESKLWQGVNRHQEELSKLRAERDHLREVAKLAEKDRQTYHSDADRAVAKVAELRDECFQLQGRLDHANELVTFWCNADAESRAKNGEMR